MTILESRIMGYICFIFCAAFSYFDAPWLSLLFMIGALGLISYSLYLTYLKGGSGPGPLKPA